MVKIALKADRSALSSAIIFLILSVSLPCFGELTANDIRQIVREELAPVKQEIEVIKRDLAEVKIEIATIKGDIKTLESRMTENIKAVEDKISLVQWFIGLLVAIVVAAIAIPQLLILRSFASLRTKEKNLTK
jgi:septal ring factor EnvC (AmiA/AmiB activator)